VREFDLRYAGQGYEVRVPVPDGRGTAETKSKVTELFHAMHERLRGHRASAEPVEVVSYRVRAEVRVPQYQPRDLGPHPTLSQRERNEVVEGRENRTAEEGERGVGPPDGRARKGMRSVQFAAKSAPLETPIWQRDGLRPDNEIVGPAIIEQIDATTVVPPGWDCRVDRHGNLRLSRDLAVAREPM